MNSDSLKLQGFKGLQAAATTESQRLQTGNIRGVERSTQEWGRVHKSTP